MMSCWPPQAGSPSVDMNDHTLALFVFTVMAVVFVAALFNKSNERNGMPKVCNACGASHADYARFCRRCGKKLR
jgi:ribosomal protein L40E